MLFAFYGAVHGIDIVYVVTQDSQLRELGNLLRMVGNVYEGDIVFFQGRITTRQGAFEFLVRNERGQEGWIGTRNITLRDSPPLPAFVTDRTWVPSYYQRFLLGGSEREDLFYHEPVWLDEYDLLTEHEFFHWCVLVGVCR